MQVPAGTRFDHAVKQAISIANECYTQVIFDFNGIQIAVTKDDTVESVGKRYDDAYKKRRAEYEASPEGIERRRLDAEEAILRQQKYDEAVRQIRTLMQDTTFNALRVKIYRDFCEASDWISVQKNLTEVIDLLQAAGFQSIEDIPQKIRDAANAKDPLSIWLCIVGNGIECMKSGMPPHPVSIPWLEELLIDLES